MKQLYLYRLFKHAPWAFTIIALFIISYAVVFYKKMDMTFFPYNSMYTIDFTKNYTAITYAMKINGEMIKITHRPYWKKDFLETSLSSYSKYISHNRSVFLDDYIHQKFTKEQTRKFLLERLTPDNSASNQWPYWYAHFAGYPIPENALIEIWQYHFRFDNGRTILVDSLSIYNTIHK